MDGWQWCALLCLVGTSQPQLPLTTARWLHAHSLPLKRETCGCQQLHLWASGHEALGIL